MEGLHYTPENFGQMRLTGLANLGDRLSYAHEILGGTDQIRGRRIAIIAFAGEDMTAASEKAEAALSYHGVKETVRVHESESSEARFILREVDGVYITGGNTFLGVTNIFSLRDENGRLLDQRPNAHKEPMDGYLKEMAEKGLVIVGTSAGLMIMGRDIRTCQDPRIIVDSEGRIPAEGLGFLPLSLHPHLKTEIHEELASYTNADPKLRLLALKNESFITLINGKLDFHGQGGRYFKSNSSHEINPGNLNHLLS